MFIRYISYCLMGVCFFPLIMQAIGLMNGHLTPCNNKFNCVITQCINGQKASLEPIYYKGSQHNAHEILKKVLAQFERIDWITDSDNYIHVTFTTKVWKFVDDVEFYFPEEENVIHMRSASRVGTYDLGVNKRRLKKIKKLFYLIQS